MLRPPRPATRDHRGAVSSFIAVGIGVALTVVVVSALLVWVIEANSGPAGTTRVARAFRSLAVGPGLQLVAERRFGSDSCTLGECPRVDRYYATALSVEAACAAIAPRLSAWATNVHSVAGPEGVGPSCGFQGKKNRFDLNCTIAPNTSIESEADSRTVDESVTVPHTAIVLVSLADSG